MELVSISKALELIRSSAAGTTLHLGLYKNCEQEPGYDELRHLLGYRGDVKISNGPHKVYSEYQEYATGWINGIAYRPDREPGYYDDITSIAPVIGGLRYYSWNYNDLHKLAEDITNNSSVNATYDEETDKILLVAKIPGKNGIISLEPPADKTYWDNPPEQFVSGPTLDYEAEQNAIYVWIKHTSLFNETTEDYDIRIKVIIPTENTEVKLSERWIWDEYSEKPDNKLSYINWDDTTPLEYINDVNSISHLYTSPGEYDIKISGLHLCDNNIETEIFAKEIEFKTHQVVSTKNSITDGIETVIGDIFVSQSA
jgi:hypothetical protein